MTDKPQLPPLDSETVAAYLRLHPEFFIDHDELIPDLRIPHQRGDTVSVNYVGKLPDGTVFDDSAKHGGAIELPVNEGVIAGWLEGLQLMQVGEKFRLYVPSELAYGAESPSPVIPANSVLVFDLELLGIKDAAAQAAEQAESAEGEPAAE